ncbi:MAG: hypothetical protein H7062_14605 [Candidatus Saccharimonas sp.]|nr:hypothetical protein [Planctomycetaceae bacterium]
MLVKALVTAIFFGMVGLLIGPLVGMFLIPGPPGPCGVGAIIPLGIGAMACCVLGLIGGFLFGLLF